jgi:hypothetical protein
MVQFIKHTRKETQFMLTAPGYPYMFVRSISTNNHSQCANSLALDMPSLLKTRINGYPHTMFLPRPFVVDDEINRAGGEEDEPDVTSFFRDLAVLTVLYC